MGIIPLENLIPEVALVKAMWVLGNCDSYDDIKNKMLENYSSEFSWVIKCLNLILKTLD